LIQFSADRVPKFARVLSMCETEPALALRVSNKALKEGNQERHGCWPYIVPFFISQAPMMAKAKAGSTAATSCLDVAHLDPAQERTWDVSAAAQRVQFLI